ncbi:hypothetical protein D3C78_1265020 [compost metagenome]
MHLAHHIIDHVPHRQWMTITDVVSLTQGLLISEQSTEQGLIKVLHAGEINLVQAIANDCQAAFALHLQQAWENADIPCPSDKAWA